MADPKKTRRKYTRDQAKKAMPAIREFNRLAEMFINLLGQKIEQKEQRLNTVSFMVNSYSPLPKWHNTINIQTVDMKNTIVRKQGDYSYNQKMNWEDDYQKRKKGIVL